MLEDALEKAQLLDEIALLRKSNIHLQTKLLKAKAKVDDLVQATQEAAYNAVIDLGGIGKAQVPNLDKRKAREAVALWHLTDWQGGKVTPSYNSGVMVTRVNEFVTKAHKLTEDYRKARPVKHCWILLGGDMCEGLFNYPDQQAHIDASLFQQYVTISKLLVETVQKALGIYETVTVIAEYGNHGRIGSKRDAVVRSDNVDRMIYELSRQLLAGEKRLTWEDCPEDIQKVEIGQYRSILLHGDEFGRNGFSSQAGIVNNIMKLQSGSFEWAFGNAYVGHYHTTAVSSLPAGGLVFQTGSTESHNRYAQVHLASMVKPSQRFQLIDPVKGFVISDHVVWLEA
jgi:hypothetical protein